MLEKGKGLFWSERREWWGREREKKKSFRAKSLLPCTLRSLIAEKEQKARPLFLSLSLFPFSVLSELEVTMSPQLIETTESDTRVVVARFVAALAAGKVRVRAIFLTVAAFFFFSSMPLVAVVVVVDFDLHQASLFASAGR